MLALSHSSLTEQRVFSLGGELWEVIQLHTCVCVCACLGWQWSLVDNVLLEVIKPPRLDHDFVGQENIDLTDSMSFPF